jgi:hypothetical protein
MRIVSYFFGIISGPPPKSPSLYCVPNIPHNNHLPLDFMMSVLYHALDQLMKMLIAPASLGYIMYSG